MVVALLAHMKAFIGQRTLFLIFGEMLIILLFIVTVTPRVVYAQDVKENPQFNIAQTLNINDPAAVDGDIMSLSDQKETLVRSKKLFDERMHGVLTENPVMVYRTKDTIPVARNGLAIVNITTLGGVIGVGDYITSSPIPGKGQKAEDFAGYMLGIALEPFGEKDGNPLTYEGKTLRAGKIKISIGIGPASPAVIKAAGGVMGTLRQIISGTLYNIKTSRELERMIRYITAALIAIVIIYIAYRTFGRNITKGIEAIGRNPLAKVPIQSMIIVNVALLALVTVGGVILSLVIISL